MGLMRCDTLDAAAPLLAGDESAFLFKHSTRCPVSARAHDEVMRFVDDHPEIPVHLVLVIESRPISHALAERLGVRHESPQAILVREGRAIWDASHHGITADALAQAWSEA